MNTPQVPITAHPEAIRLSKVVKKFRNTAGEVTVLKGIDLSLNQGEFIAIVGKSGSGKSTLLNMITGIDHPSSGEVLVNGVDIYRMNESERALWRGRTLGIVFQFFQLLPMLTLQENVMLPMDYVNNYNFDDRPERAMSLLKMVGLEDFAHKLPTAVSTGQQQSAAIARALANDPPVIVADEPTGNLDSRSADKIISLFDHLVHAGKTIAMVTHDPSLTERTTRTIIITDGELINETVANSLPLLSHHQMMEVTRQITRRTCEPGEVILDQGEHVDNFYMIEDGQVEICLKGSSSRKVVLAKLNRGEFFGEVELIKGGKSIAAVRASTKSTVRLAVLPRAEFVQTLKGSPHTEESLSRLVQDRLEENRAAVQHLRRSG